MIKAIFAGLLLVSVLTVSCESFRTLEVDKDYIECRGSENTVTIRIKTTGSWSVRPDLPLGATPFYTITPDSGRGDAEVMIHVDSNPSKSARSQDIRIVGKDESKTVTLVQKAPFPAIECDIYIQATDDAGHIPANGGKVAIGGGHFGDLVIRCDAEDVTFNRTTFPHNAYTDVFVFYATVPACPKAEGRTIQFTVTGTTESGETSTTYSVIQSGISLFDQEIFE